MRVIAALDTVGTVLILQLTFFICSLPVIAVVPAAVALQRSMSDRRLGDKVGMRSFFAHFAVAWRQYWLIGIGIVAIAVGFLVAIAFWVSADVLVGWVSLGVLAVVWGLLGALYLALLVESDQQRDAAFREAGAAAFALVVRRPLAALLALVAFGTWLVLLGFVPTLVLVVSGIVPALIAHYILGPPRVAPDPQVR